MDTPSFSGGPFSPPYGASYFPLKHKCLLSYARQQPPGVQFFRERLASRRSPTQTRGERCDDVSSRTLQMEVPDERRGMEPPRVQVGDGESRYGLQSPTGRLLDDVLEAENDDEDKMGDADGEEDSCVASSLPSVYYMDSASVVCARLAAERRRRRRARRSTDTVDQESSVTSAAPLTHAQRQQVAPPTPPRPWKAAHDWGPVPGRGVPGPRPRSPRERLREHMQLKRLQLMHMMGDGRGGDENVATEGRGGGRSEGHEGSRLMVQTRERHERAARPEAAKAENEKPIRQPSRQASRPLTSEEKHANIQPLPTACSAHAHTTHEKEKPQPPDPSLSPIVRRRQIHMTQAALALQRPSALPSSHRGYAPSVQQPRTEEEGGISSAASIGVGGAGAGVSPISSREREGEREMEWRAYLANRLSERHDFVARNIAPFNRQRRAFAPRARSIQWVPDYLWANPQVRPTRREDRGRVRGRRRTRADEEHDDLWLEGLPAT
ncbi:unnamed protein product [Vitrella brassicaformis CCMP3155]|uniref:Uncharacterized protein n=1 Tax=Vitrella brassicaformis (strain CCMP3155) TaxID=1169540 RepID=A0A0G4EVC4_VITBC|nr:unnamed protein product [Vitrella brassicaformis CCMP3155]|eukprot:CEM02346.1 unnamed protein product [Vitrella brassicaformis CCMP3155]